MKIFALPEELGEALGQYLSTKPYREVVTLMAGLAQLQEVGEIMAPEVSAHANTHSASDASK